MPSSYRVAFILNGRLSYIKTPSVETWLLDSPVPCEFPGSPAMSVRVNEVRPEKAVDPMAETPFRSSDAREEPRVGSTAVISILDRERVLLLGSSCSPRSDDVCSFASVAQ